MSRRASILLAVVAVLSTATVVTIGAAGPGLPMSDLIGYWGPAFAEVVAAVSCFLARQRVVGRARLVWGLFAAGLGLWALTDLAYGATSSLAGVDVPEISIFDAGWLGFYLPMLTGVLLVYEGLRPERGWQGALDAVLLVVSLGVLSWVLLLGKVASQASDGSVATAVNLLYPGLDLIGAAALGWVLLRSGRRSPPWLWWVAGAFGFQLLGGLAYIGAVLGGSAAADWASSGMYMLAAWVWCAAGLVRRADPVRLRSPAGYSRPPLWSRALPFALACAMLLVVHPGQGTAGLVALIGLAIAGVRLLATERINARLLAERNRLLSTDPLTGAYNRRFLGEELPRAVARAARSGEPLGVVAFDLDRFKQVNDRFGHSAGDECLARVVHEVQDSLRLGDVLCRLGGDEFLVLLPGADESTSFGIADRILAAARRVGRDIDHWEPVSASLGVSTFPDHASDPESLLCSADEALYLAKRAGRDRVVVSSGHIRTAAQYHSDEGNSLSDSLLEEDGGSVGQPPGVALALQSPVGGSTGRRWGATSIRGVPSSTGTSFGGRGRGSRS